MQPVRFDARSYEVRGQRVHLYAGEIHYFRVPRPAFRDRLRLLRAAGGNAVSTYVPWIVHEPAEGVFAFSGKPWLELEAFLDTAAAEGLYVIARPGPYVYSELVYDGLPRWLCDGYPALRAKDRAGRDFRRSSISYLHPLFLEKARRWYDRVCPLLAAYTVSRGGPIAFAQIDDEITGIHTWFGTLDYNPETMGFGREDGRYPRWLAARHGSLDALAAAYEAKVDAFASVEPPAVPAASPRLPELRRAKDYLDFYLSTVAEYGLTLAGWMREHGLDVPIVHNSASPLVNPIFRELSAALKPGGFVLGSDHYYTLGQDWPQNNPTPQYAVQVFVSLETLRLMDAPPTVLELPGGSAADWPPIGPEDAQACYFAHLALGMKGHNLYVFAGGPNPPGTAGTADVYDYGAAIGADGRVRPLYRAQQALGAFLSKHPSFPAATRESDCRVLVDWLAARADQWTKARDPFTFAPQEAWEFLRKGILTTAFCAGLSPELVDGETDGFTEDVASPLVAATSSVMPAALQRRLVSFLERGGRLLFGPVLPELDERLSPCTILRDFLGVTEESRRAPADAVLQFPFTGSVYTSGLVITTPRPPIGASVLGHEQSSGDCAGWMKPLDGGGRVIWLGARWTHGMRYHTALLRGCLDRLGIEPRLTCSNPSVWCALWTHGEQSVLFAMNLLVSRQDAEISCRPSWSREPVRIPPLSLPGMTVETIDLEAPARAKRRRRR
ncbi:MAG: beta-galactosidase [Minicystis sp.]